MQELVFCLESEDGWVQEEGILKLCERLKKAGTSPCETPEYSQLTLLLTSERPALGRLAARALLLLVSEAIVPLPTALQSAVTSLTVGSGTEGLIWTITELVQSALAGAAHGQKSVPALTDTNHPHVTLLRSLPHCWRRLAAETERLLFAVHSAEYREVALQYVTPLLWSCCRAEAPSELRARLVAALCKLARQGHSSRPVLRALEALARLKLPAPQLAVELPPLCSLLVDFALEVDDRALLRSLTPLTIHCLHLQMTEGLGDVTSALDNVTRLLELELGGDVELILFSDIISQSSALALRDGRLIGTARRLLEAGRFCAATACLLLPPLLRAVSVMPALSQLLEPLLPLVAARPTGAAAVQLDENPYWPAVSGITPSLTRAALLAETLRGGEQTQLAWLRHLAVVSERVDPDAVCERGVLALLVSSSSSAAVRRAALTAAMAAVRRRPDVAPDLFYTAVYRLRLETQPELTLLLLRALPQLAVHKAVVPPLVRLLTSLVTSTGRLAAEAVRLLSALWRQEERCLPYLLAVLKMDGRLSGQPRRLLMVKLAAIAELCEVRPASGKDQLAVLSRVLTELTDAESAASCSLALTGIASLCRAEVLDVRTTWRILAPRLRQERRPAVLARYMDFLSLVPQLHVPSEEYEAFTRDVATVLWQQVTGKRPLPVVLAALRALGSFKPSTFTLAMLPAAAKRGLVVPTKLIATPLDATKSPEELFTYVPGECYTLLLSFLPEPLLADYGHLLTALVRSEVQLIGRGILFTAKERARREGGEPTNLSYLEPSSIIRALVTRLKHTAGEGPGPDTGRTAAETAACLRPLSGDLEQPLPPLELTFLEDLLAVDGSVADLCVEALARHCSSHASAANALKRLMAIPPPEHAPTAALDRLWDVLGSVGRGVPPAALLPFLQHHVSLALAGGSTAVRVLASIGAALRDERLPEANRVTIGNVIEAALQDVSADQKEIFNAFLGCIAELPTSNLERLSSPSLWWSVEKDKLVVAAEVRSHMSCLGDDDRPMVWMNEIIDVAGTSGLGSEVYGAVCHALTRTCGHHSNPEWLMELMGQMRAVKAGKVASDAPVDQTLIWMSEVLLSAVLFWSPLTLAGDPAALTSSPASRRARLFPAALRLLLEQPQWRPLRKQTCGWLQRLQDNPVIADRLQLSLLLPVL